MKTSATSRELARILLIVALAFPFAWHGYRRVHVFAVLAAVLALVPVMVTAMVRLWTDRPRLPLWRRVLPLVLCLLVPVAGTEVGPLVDRLDFRLRRHVHYRQVVEMLERGEIVSANATATAFALPHPYESEANGAVVTRDPMGGLRVEFGWSRHLSYAYCKQGNCTVDPRWKGYRRIDEEWLLVNR